MCAWQMERINHPPDDAFSAFQANIPLLLGAFAHLAMTTSHSPSKP